MLALAFADAWPISLGIAATAISTAGLAFAMHKHFLSSVKKEASDGARMQATMERLATVATDHEDRIRSNERQLASVAAMERNVSRLTQMADIYFTSTLTAAPGPTNHPSHGSRRARESSPDPDAPAGPPNGT